MVDSALIEPELRKWEVRMRNAECEGGRRNGENGSRELEWGRVNAEVGMGNVEIKATVDATPEKPMEP